MDKRYTYTNYDYRFWRAMGGGEVSTSGERIGHAQAMKVATFFACVRNISEDIAKLPDHVRQKQPEGSRSVPDHPVQLMLDNPNPEMDAHTAEQTLMSHAVSGVNGGGYAEIEFSAGRPYRYWPLDPTSVVMKRHENGDIYYEVHGITKKAIIPARYMLHIHGLGFDGYTGYDMADICRQVLGAARALDKFRGSFFGNSATPSGVLKHPEVLSPEAQTRLREQFEARYSGANNAHKVMVLEEGMEWSQVSIDPERAQMDTLTTLTGYDICRAFRMPPHKVGYLDNATFSNIEEQNIEYVTDALDSWRARFVAEFNRKLFSEAERAAGLYIDKSLKGLLRGNMAQRAQFYKDLYYMGAINADEIRAYEEENPTGTPNGKRFFVQQNLAPLDMVDKLFEQQAEPAQEPEAQPEPTPEPTEDNTRVLESYRMILEDRIQAHILRVELDKVKRDRAGDAFYERHETYIANTLTPTVDAIRMGVAGRFDASRIASDYAHIHVGVSQSTANTERMAEWENGTRAEVAARTILNMIKKVTEKDRNDGTQ